MRGRGTMYGYLALHKMDRQQTVHSNPHQAPHAHCLSVPMTDSGA